MRPPIKLKAIGQTIATTNIEITLALVAPSRLIRIGSKAKVGKLWARSIIGNMTLSAQCELVVIRAIIMAIESDQIYANDTR